MLGEIPWMLKKTVTKKVYDCKSKELLSVVGDVESYTDFIPFCSDVNIFNGNFSRLHDHFSARMLINLKFTSETFLTNVVINKKLKTILITGNTAPFKNLIANWSFVDRESFCEVTFSLEVSFKSFMKEKLVSLSFDKMAVKIIDAFEKRAKELKILNRSN
jgi:coenzyme Q-binding protein COQ10